MKHKNALNDEQKQLFIQTVEDYVTLLNLRNWRVSVSDKPCKGAIADCSTSLEDMMAVIRYGSDWGPQEITDQIVKETAIHELLHVFLSVLIASAVSRDASATAAAEHSVITVLERLLA